MSVRIHIVYKVICEISLFFSSRDLNPNSKRNMCISIFYLGRIRIDMIAIFSNISNSRPVHVSISHQSRIHNFGFKYNDSTYLYFVYGTNGIFPKRKMNFSFNFHIAKRANICFPSGLTIPDFEQNSFTIKSNLGTLNFLVEIYNFSIRFLGTLEIIIKSNNSIYHWDSFIN